MIVLARIFPTLLLAIVAFLSTAGHAADKNKCRIGEIHRIDGDVNIIRDGVTLTPTAGATFCTGDNFVTGTQGVAALHFQDGTEITVGKNSWFVIERWQQRRLLANKATFSLVKGAFRALTGAIAQRRHRVEVKTVIAAIGVRGTDFWGGLNLTPDALEVVMLEGKGVYVKNDAGMVELTTAGTGTTVRAGKIPAVPNTWPTEKVQRAVETITP